MKHKIILIVLIMVFIALFLSLGLPFLKKVRNNEIRIKSITKKERNFTEEGLRIVDIDLSIESICLNFVTNEPLSSCNEENCDRTCEREGCEFFGLLYGSSKYVDEKCHCQCLEENKIKKALNIGDEK